MGPYDEQVRSATLPVNQSGMVSPKHKGRLGQNSPTTVTSGPSTMDISGKSPGCQTVRIKSGQTVCRPQRLGIDT